jgi:hypothetical protein
MTAVADAQLRGDLLEGGLIPRLWATAERMRHDFSLVDRLKKFLPQRFTPERCLKNG